MIPALPLQVRAEDACAVFKRDRGPSLSFLPHDKAKGDGQQRAEARWQQGRHARTGAELGSTSLRTPRVPLPAPMTREQKRLSFPPPCCPEWPLGYVVPKPRHGRKAADRPGGKGTPFWGEQGWRGRRRWLYQWQSSEASRDSLLRGTQAGRHRRRREAVK